MPFFFSGLRKSVNPALFLALLLLGGAERLNAQLSSVQPVNEATDGQTYPVRGTVIDSVTRQPIARALVNAQRDAVLTDAEGHFELHLPAGFMGIMLQRPGYSASFIGSARMLQVAADMPELNYQLVPDALITGHVTLPGADMADGVRIMTYRRTVQNGRRQWAQQQTAASSSDGDYRIGGLQPGSYLVYMQMERDPDAPRGRSPTTFGFTGQYFPGTTDPAAAGVLTLSAGQHAQADFTLERKRFYPVTVTLINSEGGRGFGIQVFDESGRPVEAPMRRNLDGSTQFSVPNGSYYAEARGGFGGGRGRGGAPASYGRVDFKVSSAPVTGLGLTLFPLHPIPVTIRKDFTASENPPGEGVTRGLPSDTTSNPGMNLMLTPADDFPGRMGTGSGSLQPVKGADSTSFELQGVEPGRYWLIANAFQGYVGSITSGGVDLARDPLVVGPGGASSPIEVTLRNDTGTITGQTTDDPAATPAATPPSPAESHPIFVYAVPLFPTTGDVYQYFAVASHQVTMANLAPGAYRVMAFDTQQEIEFHSAEGLGRYGSQGQTVTVDPGGTANVQLEVAHAADGEHP